MRFGSLPRFAAVCLATTVAFAQAPVNDEPAGAIVVTDGVNPGAPTGASGFTFDNINATTSVGYATPCGSALSKDVFFLYTPTTTGLHAISTCTPTDFATVSLPDSALAVYDAANPLVSLGCDDDGCNSLGSTGSASSFLSHLSINLTAGSSYYLRVAAWGTAAVTGTFHLNVVPPAVVSDTCAGAIPLVPGYNWGSLAGMTATGTIAPNCASTTGAVTQFLATTVDVWYSYTATQNATVGVLREGATMARLGVFTGTCGAEVAVSGANTCTGSVTVESTWVAAAGTTYLIRMGNTAQTTCCQIYVRETPFPANDECAGAIPLVTGANGPFNNLGASTSAGSATCQTHNNDVWFSWTAPLTATALISGCGSTSDPVFTVYGSCGGAEVACDDDDATNIGPCATTQTLNPFVRTAVTAGTTYLIRVGNNTAANMFFNVNIEYEFSLALTYDNVNFTFTVADVAGNPGDLALNALTLNLGAYPNGYFYGVDIPIFEVFTLILSGPPFFVLLDGTGAFSQTLTGVPPLGVTAYGVGVDFTPAGIFAKKSLPVSVVLL